MLEAGYFSRGSTTIKRLKQVTDLINYSFLCRQLATICKPKRELLLALEINLSNSQVAIFVKQYQSEGAKTISRDSRNTRDIQLNLKSNCTLRRRITFSALKQRASDFQERMTYKQRSKITLKTCAGVAYDKNL